MVDPASLIERRVPDRLATADLPAPVASEIDFLAGRADTWADVSVPAGLRARTLVLSGRPDAARALLTGLDLERLGPQQLAAAVWAASRVGPLGRASELRRAVSGADEFLEEGDLPLGPRSMFEGLVAILDGELLEAVERLGHAVDEGDGRAPFWGAMARLELGRVLLGTADLDPESDELARRQAHRSLGSARTFFAAVGHEALLGRLEALLGPPRPDGLARPGVGTAIAGDEWVVGMGVQPVTTIASRPGLAAIAHLIDQRHRAVPAVELSAVLDGRPPADGSPIDPDLAEAVAAGDEQARIALRGLIRDDRARSRVSKALRRTITAVSAEHRVLGEHLGATVWTGYLCRYAAPTTVVWQR